MTDKASAISRCGSDAHGNTAPKKAHSCGIRCCSTSSSNKVLLDKDRKEAAAHDKEQGEKTRVKAKGKTETEDKQGGCG